MKNHSVTFMASSDKSQLSLIGIGLEVSWLGMMDEIGGMTTPGEIGSEELEGKYSFIGDDDAIDECSTFYISKVGKDNNILAHKTMRASIGGVG